MNALLREPSCSLLQRLPLTAGVLMYRDILNDEWLTDAVVIPPGLENRALKAYHDSGYGAHLGSYKTRIAMQPHVWFPNLEKKVETHHCANCLC